MNAHRFGFSLSQSTKLTTLLCCAMPFCLLAGAIRADDGLQNRINDKHADGADFWVYNDIEAAKQTARKENKPLFVTFRCVPCKACSGFDAEVAKGRDQIKQLGREKFICVRQVEMKGVDLTQFQFDHDLNWAAMFINADGTVYARYGTQSAEGPDAYNSIQGLVNTMNRVLELHADYPNNKKSLADKRAKKKPYRTAMEMPGLKDKQKYAASTTRRNCIHCHNIHDAENAEAHQSGKFNFDMLYRYPLPQNVGLEIDAKQGIRVARVAKSSAAAETGLKPGESITHMDGQAITSIADMQWVLHHVPNKAATVTVTGDKTGKHTLELKPGWKKYDISWRGSIWELSPVWSVWAPPLKDNEKRQRNLPAKDPALLVKWINQSRPSGQAAQRGGLRQGDVIVAVDGKPVAADHRQFCTHLKFNYKVGDTLPITVQRNGRKRDLKIKLVE